MHRAGGERRQGPAFEKKSAGGWATGDPESSLIRSSTLEI